MTDSTKDVRGPAQAPELLSEAEIDELANDLFEPGFETCPVQMTYGDLEDRLRGVFVAAKAGANAARRAEWHHQNHLAAEREIERLRAQAAGASREEDQGASSVENLTAIPDDADIHFVRDYWRTNRLEGTPVALAFERIAACLLGVPSDDDLRVAVSDYLTTGDLAPLRELLRASEAQPFPSPSPVPPPVPEVTRETLGAIRTVMEEWTPELRRELGRAGRLYGGPPREDASVRAVYGILGKIRAVLDNPAAARRDSRTPREDFGHDTNPKCAWWGGEPCTCARKGVSGAASDDAERARFEACGYNLGSIEEACDAMDDLSALARTEAAERISAERALGDSRNEPTGQRLHSNSQGEG